MDAHEIPGKVRSRRRAAFIAAGSVAGAIAGCLLLPTAASAFNPQPEPPGRVYLQISGPHPCVVQVNVSDAAQPLAQATAVLPIGELLPACTPPRPS